MSVDYEAGPVERFGVTLAPGWTADIDNMTPANVELSVPGIAPSPYQPWPPDHMFPGGISFNAPAAETGDPEALAVSLVAALATSALHEGLEWVRANGSRLAAPHPMNEDAMWDWLVDEMRALVRKYMDRYPPEFEDHDPPEVNA